MNEEKLKHKNRIEDFQAKVKSNGASIWIKMTAEIIPELGYIEGSMHNITVSKILTPAEKKVLGILLQGKTNSEIAYTLGRSVRTIEDHRARIMKKMNAESVVDLVEKVLVSEWRY
ncbi:MAG: LuxR C-terminal-related transcriptional regulator [Planctomycetota bacterium]|jgi:DNA-binding CsgD family transcriptional regulator